MDKFSSDKEMKHFLTILIQVELAWLQQLQRLNVNVANNKTIGLFSDILKLNSPLSIQLNSHYADRITAPRKMYLRILSLGSKHGLRLILN